MFGAPPQNTNTTAALACCTSPPTTLCLSREDNNNNFLTKQQIIVSTFARLHTRGLVFNTRPQNGVDQELSTNTWKPTQDRCRAKPPILCQTEWTAFHSREEERKFSACSDARDDSSTSGWGLNIFGVGPTMHVLAFKIVHRALSPWQQTSPLLGQ